jgi:hypothetical protein
MWGRIWSFQLFCCGVLDREIQAANKYNSCLRSLDKWPEGRDSGRAITVLQCAVLCAEEECEAQGSVV